MSTESTTSNVLEKLQEDVRAAITSALRTKAVSISSFQEKRTGNSYQSIRLGDEILRGFRSADRTIFSGLKIRGKTVLDLGCNLGEVCRDAVRAGAASATGIEYDPYFVQLGRYVAAFNGLSNVAYHQGDLTDPATYTGEYDYVAALSVFTYIRNHLDLLAKMVREVLIIETHSVRDNWMQIYLEPLQKHFAHVAIIGFSDHKAAQQAEIRYMILASHKPLESVLVARAREARDEKQFSIDMSSSSIPHYDAVMEKLGITRGATIQDVISSARSACPDLTLEEVVSGVREVGIVQSPAYWASYLRGLGDYRSSNTFDENNFYYRTINELVREGLYDGAFKSLMSNKDKAIARLKLRFDSVDGFDGRSDASLSDPVILFNPMIPDGSDSARGGMLSRCRFALQPGGRQVSVVALDGHHRLFVGYVHGAESLACHVTWYPEVAGAKKALRAAPELMAASWSSVFPLSQDFTETEPVPA